MHALHRGPYRSGSIFMGLWLVTGLSACMDRPDTEENHAHLTLTAPGSTYECVDPPQGTPDPADQLAIAPPRLELGDALVMDGLQVNFGSEPRGWAGTIQVIVPFAEDDPRGTVPYVDKTFAGRTVRIQTAPISVRTTGTFDFLTTGGASLRDMELVVTYGVNSQSTGASVGVIGYSVLSNGTRAEADQFDPPGGYAAPPGTCEEQAIVRFGLFPYGMPPVKFPDIIGCNNSRCVDVAHAWLHLHHNVWRANQMFAVLDGMSPAQRDYFWERPGMDAGGNGVSIRSSPAYWFGDYDGDRYAAVKETMNDYFNIVKTAKTGAINLRLQCPSYASNPGNVCFNSNAMGHHWVKGWINFCDSAFTDTTCGAPNVADTVHRVMHHEPLHHVFTHINGLKAIRDTVSHFHGGACVSNPTTAPVYCETGNGANDVRHFVEHGEDCWHHDKVIQTVDANALFVQTIGDMVDQGVMTHWPLPAPPTPKPPQCVGGPNCLCEDTDPFTDPDGDYSTSKFCDDNGSMLVCMKTKFNASDTVGICTDCDDFRGPGCPCNDLSSPCDKGFCWGDDTFANNAGTGTCYENPPPSWGCLADCDMLMGAGAFCMWDHPQAARCVPVGTSLPEASNCWDAGGHMDPQELSCSMAPECIVTNDCHDLGYPSYFVCDGTLRCVVP